MNYGTVIAKANGHELVAFEQFGSYQGDWIIITKNNRTWYVWKGCYGSCSGCDDLESFEMNRGTYDEWTLEECKGFAKDYKPFIEVGDTMWQYLLEKGDLKSLMPANTRLGFSGEDYRDMKDEDVWKRIEDSIKNSITEKEGE